MLNKILCTISLIALLPMAAQAAEISGAGSTFVYPVLSKWAEAYKADTGISVNYQSIGSGGGIKQIKSKTVDFGATDMPLSAKELEEANLIQFPIIVGGVVPVINLPSVPNGHLTLNGPVLAQIYMGKITKWNDPQIGALNITLMLPNTDITVVHRSDGSGTTFLFTNYLSKVDPDWQANVGSSTSIDWPAGVGGKGNEGVANTVLKLNGTIGYVEYAYAKQNHMNTANLFNRETRNYPVGPNLNSFQAAAESADWIGTPGFGAILTDQPGKTSWPIAGATFLLMRKDSPRNKEITKFVQWILRNGDVAATNLDYVPLPSNVKFAIKTELTPFTAD